MSAQPIIAEVEVQESASIIDMSVIHKIKGHNPRRVRSASRLADMRESIRSKRVLQPILLRPHPTIEGEYELVAGETRFDLNSEVGHTTIPALIRVISDAELLEIASSENIHRQAMVPMDEGHAARNLLSQHQDKDTVCKMLGWSRSKLDGRIQLTHCIDLVAQALCDEEIAIGHAQLLSGLRPDSQKGALEAIKRDRLSVVELRSLIEGMALTLANAIFDTADCATCPHNSSVQTSLFDADTSDGRCLNKSCFDDKTQEKLGAIKSELEESYNTVTMDSEVAQGATVIIASTGDAGVGAAQVAACAGCQHYGALIGSQVGNEGRVIHGVCFNTVCHGEKVNDYRALLDTELASDVDTRSVAQPSAITSGPGQAAKKPAVSSDATPKVILERNHQVKRVAASEQVLNEARVVQIISILSLLSDSGVTFKRAPNGWPSALSGSSRARAAQILDEMSDAELDALQKHLASKVMLEANKFGAGSNGTDSFGSIAEWIVTSRKQDLSDFFVVDAEYLKPHTKPVIKQMLIESGFAKDFDESRGDGAFNKMVSGLKGDIIEAVSESDFNFKGYLPKGLSL